jgi:hypothetical protein
MVLMERIDDVKYIDREEYSDEGDEREEEDDGVDDEQQEELTTGS